VIKLNREFRPKTDNQAEYIRTIVEQDITVCIGVAGSGKTACAVGLAMEYLALNKCKRIIISRPTIIADDGDNNRGLGFLPGDILDKMDPFLRPILDELYTYMSKSDIDKLIKEQIIEITPLDYMRGRNFHDSFVILDEAQNATYKQIKMLTTRLGSRSKIVVNGDIEQHDRSKNSGLYEWLFDAGFAEDDNFGFCELDESDIIRHPLVKHIIVRTRNYENSKKV